MRVRQPPPSLTAPLQGYLQEIASALNALPNVSAFTGITPIGRVLGDRGDLAYALDTSTSTTSLWWFNNSPIGVSSTRSWQQITVI
jgi:hypothetical protein